MYYVEFKLKGQLLSFIKLPVVYCVEFKLKDQL